jgi:hypothetical protein
MTMMTRKHYIAFADALHYVKPTHTQPVMNAQWVCTVNAVMSVLASDNPRFDKGRFMEWAENGNPSKARLAAIKARAINALVDRDRSI